jgi:hypothetical protein
MMSRWKAALLAGAAIGVIGHGAFAQSPLRPAAGQPPAPAAPLYDPQQFPAWRGQVRQFTLTPRGDIDGLILADGTEVKTPPHLSTQIAYVIKPGDTVTIHGLHAAALPLVQAVSITDEASGRTVIDNGPPGPGRGPAAPPLPAGAEAGAGAPLPGLTEVRGRVRMDLHGPRGEVNGVLLDDGTILRLPPPEAYRLASLLEPGQPVVAEGTELVTAMGRVMEVRQIGTSREQLSLVEAPPPGRRPRPPRGPGFEPPSPPRP